VNADGAANFIKSTGEFQASTGQGSDLALNKNYWGHFQGPKGIPMVQHPTLKGLGSVVSNSKVTLTTFLSCIDSTFCETNAGCLKLTSILDTSTSKCVETTSACHSSVSYGDL
jgi:hypothetical protein